MRWIANKDGGEEVCYLAGHLVMCLVTTPGGGREDAWWRVWTGDSLQPVFQGHSVTIEDAREHARDAVKKFVCSIVETL